MQPGSSTLAVLERSWSEALNTGDVGPDSDFFALGGDSLAALRIGRMIASELEADDETQAFVLAALFEEPTLGAVAVQLDRHLRERSVRRSTSEWQHAIEDEVRRLLQLPADMPIGDLYDVGLDSLKGLRLVVWLAEQGVDSVDLADVFDAATPAGLAALITDRPQSG